MRTPQRATAPAKQAADRGNRRPHHRARSPRSCSAARSRSTWSSRREPVTRWAPSILPPFSVSGDHSYENRVVPHDQPASTDIDPRRPTPPPTRTPPTPTLSTSYPAPSCRVVEEDERTCPARAPGSRRRVSCARRATERRRLDAERDARREIAAHFRSLARKPPAPAERAIRPSRLGAVPVHEPRAVSTPHIRDRPARSPSGRPAAPDRRRSAASAAAESGVEGIEQPLRRQRIEALRPRRPAGQATPRRNRARAAHCARRRSRARGSGMKPRPTAARRGDGPTPRAA